MAEKLEPIILTFGGGVNRRRRPFDIDPSECYDGQNFDLDHQFAALHRRAAFQLMGTAPNGGEIRGGGQLVKRDGSVTTWIQAGGNVYSWDGTTGFTLIGTCSPNSRLRGGRGHNWLLDQIDIITDLEKLTVVKQWDGTSFGDFPHNLSQPLYAKFVRIVNERVYFGNVQSGTDTPHVLLASKLSDDNTLTVNNRPSSALNDEDPFFIPTPDLKPMNGLEEGFGQLFISTQHGQLHILQGISAKDFSIDSFYAGSAVAGDEAMINIGNDLLLGPVGRIETLTGTINYGDVETDDVSVPIQPFIEHAEDWRFAYDRRLQKIYCFPTGQNECWVLHKSILYGAKVSPWSKWLTNHSVGYAPSSVLTLIDPRGSHEKVYMGDGSGNIFLVEGASGQDGGTSDIIVNRRSILYHLPNNKVFDFSGRITYLKAFANTVTITFECGGVTVFDQDITVTLPADSAMAVYNGNAYYSGNFYYNTGFSGRLTRQKFSAPGSSNFVQIKTEVSGAADVEIHAIELNLAAAEE